MTQYRELCERVTARLIAEIEDGPGEWVMPWHRTPQLFEVRNAATGLRYRGANTVALAVRGLERTYRSGWWATYRQWSQLDAYVRRGETGTPITRWIQPRSPTADEGSPDDAPGRRLVPKVYRVFNAAQVDGWTPPLRPDPRSGHERDQHADAWIGRTGAVIGHGFDHACYRPAVDRIELPAPDQFHDPAGYYATACHELIHWTGHPCRLDRDLTGRFGDHVYAVEELVAELGAAFACALLEITPTPRDDHAAYLAHWLRILRADPTALFTAAGRAQAAVDHLDRHDADTTP